MLAARAACKLQRVGDHGSAGDNPTCHAHPANAAGDDGGAGKAGIAMERYVIQRLIQRSAVRIKTALPAETNG